MSFTPSDPPPALTRRIFRSTMVSKQSEFTWRGRQSGSYIKWCCWGFNSIRTESEKFLSDIDQGRASMLISSDISVLQLMRCAPFMRSLFCHVPVPSANARTGQHTESHFLGHSLNQTWACPHYEGLQPPESARPDLKNCSIDFFHLQLCVVMGNHDIYIRTTPIWSPRSVQVLDTGCSSKQVTGSKVSLARRSHWVDPFHFCTKMVFSPSVALSLSLSPPSLCLSLSPVTCWNTFRSWVELLSAHSSLCVVFEDYYAQRHPHWASRQLRGQNP